ncbi:hypothetical protein D3C72_2191590 [compost metagenome]
MHDAEQIGRDIAIQIVSENKIAISVVHARTVGGDHVRLNLQAIADLPDVNMVATRREDKIHATRGQEF